MTLTAAASKGDLTLQVDAYQCGLAPGGRIQIGDELVVFSSFGSIVLLSPLQRDHPIGTRATALDNQPPSVPSPLQLGSSASAQNTADVSEALGGGIIVVIILAVLIPIILMVYCYVRHKQGNGHVIWPRTPSPRSLGRGSKSRRSFKGHVCASSSNGGTQMGSLPVVSVHTQQQLKDPNELELQRSITLTADDATTSTTNNTLPSPSTDTPGPPLTGIASGHLAGQTNKRQGSFTASFTTPYAAFKRVASGKGKKASAASAADLEAQQSSSTTVTIPSTNGADPFPQTEGLTTSSSKSQLPRVPTIQHPPLIAGPDDTMGTTPRLSSGGGSSSDAGADPFPVNRDSAAASSASGELSGRAASFTSFFQGGADSAREDAKGEGKETKVEMEGDDEKGKEKEDPNAPRSYQAAVGGTGASAPAAAAPAAADLQTQEEDGMVYTRI